MPQRISVHQNKRMGEKGFSLTESLVALTVGTMIIAGSGFAMRSTQSLIQGSGEKANQRQNTIWSATFTLRGRTQSLYNV